MKLIGIRTGTQNAIGRLFDDDTVTGLSGIAEFYAETDQWLALAAALEGGAQHRMEIEEVPAVPPAARVLCVGLNYRLHAEEAGLPLPRYPAIFGRWTASREHQLHSSLWTVGKNADYSGPISPIVTADEVGDPGAVCDCGPGSSARSCRTGQPRT